MAVTISTDYQPFKFCLAAERTLAMNPTEPVKLMQKAGAVQLVQSAENKASWDWSVSMPGKNKSGTGAAKVWASYEKPFATGGSSTPGLTACTAASATTSPYKHMVLDLDKEVNRAWKIGPAEFMDICENRGGRNIDTFRRKHFEMIHEINADIIDSYYAVLDDYPVSGNAPIEGTIETLNIATAAGQLQPLWASKIRQTYFHANYTGRLNMLAGNLGSAMVDVANLAGRPENHFEDNLIKPLDYQGINFAADTVLDTRIRALETGELATDSYALVFPVGSFVMFDNYNLYAEGGDYNIVDGQNLWGTMQIENILYDIHIKFNDCDTGNVPTWTIVLSKKYGFGYIPAAEYAGSKGLKYMYKVSAGSAFAVGDLLPS